jgi:transmembrane sensor
MSTVSTISPDIRAEAAAWLARLRADDKHPDVERAFRVWLTADPLHAAAFETVTEVWDLAGAAWSEPVVGFPTSKAPTRRRVLVAGGAGALALAGAGISLWQRAYAGVYETAVGEQKHIVLADGTQVFLDTDTRIHAVYDSKMRVVALDRGRCNFHVMESDGRPFVVDAAAQRIVAERTSFDVRRDGDDVCVVLLQGSAWIGDRDASSHRELVRAGERLVATNAGARKDKPNLAPLLAWQTGQAVFDNETVAGAIREMNRYSIVKIEAGDSIVARMRISGVYRVGDNVAFARSVAALLPIYVEFGTDQVRLMADQGRLNRT